MKVSAHGMDNDPPRLDHADDIGLEDQDCSSPARRRCAGGGPTSSLLTGRHGGTTKSFFRAIACSPFICARGGSFPARSLACSASTRSLAAAAERVEQTISGPRRAAPVDHLLDLSALTIRVVDAAAQLYQDAFDALANLMNAARRRRRRPSSRGRQRRLVGRRRVINTVRAVLSTSRLERLRSPTSPGPPPAWPRPTPSTPGCRTTRPSTMRSARQGRSTPPSCTCERRHHAPSPPSPSQP